MRIATLIIVPIVLLISLGAEPTTRPVEKWTSVDNLGFLDRFRIAHYLESAVKLQALEPDKRRAGLKALASDPKRASQVFPLCRMLFEAKPGGAFRGPLIGGFGFLDGGDYADWPLDPITLVDGVPLLIVDEGNFTLGGFTETPAEYVDYCLKECKWRDAKYAVVGTAKLKAIVEKFIAAHPKVVENVRRSELLRQAE
jgi:hypothetical protein